MPVYLDHAASGVLRPEAAAAMQEWFLNGTGNPSGAHRVARRVRAVVEDAREVVARFMGADPGEGVFTSGGTESDHLALNGPLLARPGDRSPVAVSAVEHPAVMESARATGSAGREVRIIGVGTDGLVDLDRMRSVLDRGVALVSVQTANHETGVVQPLDEIVPRIRKWSPGAAVHTDAVQAGAWLDLPEVTAGADLISISGHKIGGPQGVGALAVRHGVELAPVIHGGGQERERRSGTPNVAGIVGLAAAVEATVRERQVYGPEVRRRRDQLTEMICREVPGTYVTASGSPRVPGHCHLCFPGLESESLLFLLDERGVCASAGSSCASGAIEPSPILLAMGLDKDVAGSALRLTLGPSTTDDDIRAAATAVAAAVSALRGT